MPRWRARPRSGPWSSRSAAAAIPAALLHVLAHREAARARGLRALHVDHGLSPRAAANGAVIAPRCAGSSDVALDVLPVVVAPQGEGLEAAARRARYAALSAQLAARTSCCSPRITPTTRPRPALLRRLRGAGVHGLAAMREWRALAPGWLGRPWLACRGEDRCIPRRAGLRCRSPIPPTRHRATIATTCATKSSRDLPRAGRTRARRCAQRARCWSAAPRWRSNAAIARCSNPCSTREALSLDCKALRALDAFDLGEVVRAWIAA